jgi:ribose transport system substrate-binding protein
MSVLLGCAGEGTVHLDGGTEPDAGTAPSPFAPSAIEGVIDSMVGALTARNLPLSAKPPIAVLLKDLTGFWAPVVIGANRMSIRLACPSLVEAPLIADTAKVTTPQAAALQNGYIDKYLKTAVYRGMALAAMASDDDSVAYLDKFVDQRGPVVTIDSDSPTSKRSYVIATANYQAGFTAGAMLGQALSPGDAIFVFGSTDVNWTSGIERAQGAEDGAKSAGLVIAPRIDPKWAADTDLPALKTALADPKLNIKGMVCVYSDANLCAQAAEEVFGVPGVVKIVGFDMTAVTKTYFDKGYFLGVAVQRQYYMGQLGVLVPYAMEVLGPAATEQLLVPILTGRATIDTGIDIITTANYADYMSFLSVLGINN